MNYSFLILPPSTPQWLAHTPTSALHPLLSSSPPPSPDPCAQNQVSESPSKSYVFSVICIWLTGLRSGCSIDTAWADMLFRITSILCSVGDKVRSGSPTQSYTPGSHCSSEDFTQTVKPAMTMCPWSALTTHGHTSTVTLVSVVWPAATNWAPESPGGFWSLGAETPKSYAWIQLLDICITHTSSCTWTKITWPLFTTSEHHHNIRFLLTSCLHCVCSCGLSPLFPVRSHSAQLKRTGKHIENSKLVNHLKSRHLIIKNKRKCRPNELWCWNHSHALSR